MHKEFRAYLLDSDNRIVKAHDLLAVDDAEVSDTALEPAIDGDVVVRESSRLVVRIPLSNKLTTAVTKFFSKRFKRLKKIALSPRPIAKGFAKIEDQNGRVAAHNRAV